ncbi:hypothetical protein B0H13DRAFT_2683011 [Mycena leptocephala]|nr:hypothetical protein B0H13DRAFT_2683011 [Mycena leptocephala]
MHVFAERDDLEGVSCTSSSPHADSARNTLSPSSSTTHPLGLSTRSTAATAARGPRISRRLRYNKLPIVAAARARGVAFPVPTNITRRASRRPPPSQSHSSSASASSQSQQSPASVPQQQLPEQAGQTTLSNPLSSVLSPGGGGGLLGGGGGRGQKKKDTLKLRLDLNVEVDVQIKAKGVRRHPGFGTSSGFDDAGFGRKDRGSAFDDRGPLFD